MISRRTLLGSAVAVAIPLPRPAEAQGFESGVDAFQWRRPGYAPLRRLSMSTDRILDMLLRDLGVAPHLESELRRKVAAGEFRTERISYHQPSTRMLFAGPGRPVMASNVIAVTTTQEWASVKSRGEDRMDVYKVTDERTRMVVSIGRPWPCDNWRVAIFYMFGICIKDPVLCSYDCRSIDELRKAQFMGS